MICSFKRADGLIFIADKPINVMKLGRCIRRSDGKIYSVYEITVSPNYWEYYLLEINNIRG